MKISLTKEGPKVSAVIAGVMNWGKWGANLDTQQMAALISKCVQKGISTFDHADIYGGYTTEEAFGNAFRLSGINRSQIQLISKCGICYLSEKTPEFKIKHYNSSQEYIINAVDKSLSNLQTDYLDIVLIHRPSPIMHLEEIAEAFTRLRQSGKVRHFGVSNFTSSQMHLMHSYFPIVTNQIEASIFHIDPFFDGTIETCQQLGIHPMIWSPLAGGKIFTEPNHEIVLRLKQLSNEHDWTMEEMALQFIFHHPFSMIPVLGSSKIERIERAMDIAQYGITDEQWFEILRAIQNKKVP